MSSALVRARAPLLELRGASAGEVCEVSLAVQAGERVALVCARPGERETLLELCMGTIPPTGGIVRVRAADATLSATDLLGVVLSDPCASVDGRLSVADAVGEAGGGTVAVTAALAGAGVATVDGLLARPVHTVDPRLRARVALAAALAHAPAGLVAEDPAALPPTERADMLGAISAACGARGLALLLLTPDLGVATTMCSHVAVLLAGRIVEEGPADRLATTPRHPYTRDLAIAAGLLGGPIGSRAGSLSAVACAFSPLCPRATARCRILRPQLELVGAAAESAACWHPHGG